MLYWLTVYFTFWSSSMVAGTVSTLITAPMDMIKTRLMLQRESKEVGNYKNGFHCAYQVFKFVFIFILHWFFIFIPFLNVWVIVTVGNFVTLRKEYLWNFHE